MKPNYNPYKGLILLPFAFLCTFSACSIGMAKPPEHPQKANTKKDEGALPILHRFSWTRWERGHEDMEVFMDGVLLGKGSVAATKLSAMIFPKYTNLEINLPTMPEGALCKMRKDGTMLYPFFEEKHFLRNWVKQGVHIKFLINGKAHEIHTLAVLDKAGNLGDPLWEGGPDEEATVSKTFLFDGKEYDRAQAVLGAMAREPWVDDSVLFVFYPDRSGSSRQFNGHSNGIAVIVSFFAPRKAMQVMDIGRSLL